MKYPLTRRKWRITNGITRQYLHRRADVAPPLRGRRYRRAMHFYRLAALCLVFALAAGALRLNDWVTLTASVLLTAGGLLFIKEGRRIRLYG